jgi:hypothetical protein
MIFDPELSSIQFTPDGAAATAAVDFTELKDIGLPSPEVDDLDGTTRTSLAASANLARSFAPGLMDNGEFTFQMQPSVLADIQKVTDNVRVTGAWIVTYNGVATASFAGYIKGYDWPDPMEEQGVMDVTVKVSGDVTIAAVV